MWKKIANSVFIRLLIGVFIIALEMIILHSKVTPFLYRVIHISGLVDQIIVTTVFCSCIILSYVLLYRWYEKRKITELSLSSFYLRSSGGLMIGFLYYSLVVGVLYFLGGYLVTGIDPGIYLLTSFMATLMIGISEEILFRGVIFRLLEEKYGTWIALFISSFIFGFLHIWNPHATVLSSLAIALEAGFSLAAAYVLTRNLWFPIFFHVAWNFADNSIYGISSSRSLFISEINGSEWLTGGAFGPENSIQAIIIGLTIGIIFMIIAKRKGNIIPPSWKKQLN